MMIKKSFNLEPSVAFALENLLSKNPNISLTLAVNQALKEWLKNPKITVNTEKFSDEDVDAFMEENKGLMEKLSR